MNLFLDDERDPADVTWVALPALDWLVVRNFESFVCAVLEHGVPAAVSFDHDLCDEHYAALACQAAGIAPPDGAFAEKTGFDCARWLVDHCRARQKPLPRSIYVHTLNPVGRQRIEGIFAVARGRAG